MWNDLILRRNGMAASDFLTGSQFIFSRKEKKRPLELKSGIYTKQVLIFERQKQELGRALKGGSDSSCDEIKKEP